MRSMIRSLQSKEELKSKDVDIASTGVDTSGYMELLSGISQGTSSSERIGDQVSLRKLEFRTLLSANSTDATNVIRCIIFQWNDANNTPNIGKVLQNQTAGLVLTSQYVRDYIEQKTLSILYDQCFPLSTAGSAQVYESLLIQKFPEPTATFDTGSSSTGTGQLYVVFVSDSGGVPNPTIQFDSRLYYYDA